MATPAKAIADMVEDDDNAVLGPVVVTRTKGDQGMVTEHEWFTKQQWFHQVLCDGLQLPEATRLLDSVPRRLVAEDLDEEHHSETVGAKYSHVYLYLMKTKVDGRVIFSQTVTQHRVGTKRVSDTEGSSSSLRRLASTDRLGGSPAQGADDEPFDSQETLPW